jgi:hypothetical protein
MEVLKVGTVCSKTGSGLADHIVVGIADHPCTRCGDPLFMVVPGSDHSAQDASLLCCSEGFVQPLHDASFAVQQLVEDRIRLIIEGGGLREASRRMMLILGSKASAPPSSTQTTNLSVGVSSTKTSSIDVPVPQGFRTVSWIRQHEAELIVSSYDNERPFTLTADDGSPVFETQYFPADSPEAMRFKAQVLGVRHRRNGTRNLGWIRREEAKAVLQAYDEQRSVDFLHTRFGRGGRVEFFGAHSQAAQTYRSQTRLLRRNA